MAEIIEIINADGSPYVMAERRICRNTLQLERTANDVASIVYRFFSDNG